MGAKCCMPVKDDVPTTLNNKYRASHELYTRRSNRCSPSWSFRVDTRTHIEDIVEDPGWISHNHSGNIVSELKSSGRDTEIENASDGSGSSDTLQTAKWQKFSNELNYLAGPAGNSTESNPSCEKTEIVESSNTASSSGSKPSSSTPSDPSSSKLCGLRGNRLSKPLSEGKFPSVDHLNEEGRNSFVISFNSNDLSFGQSDGRSSSDGWSVNSFSELVISSQRQNMQNTQPSQICGLCSNIVRPSWQGNEVAVISVLDCGHVYHAECLESVTPETSKFDPSCPACSGGESITAMSQFKNGWSRNKVSGRVVADVDVNNNFVLERQKSGSYTLKPRGSGKRVFGWSFIRRNFSFGARPVRLGPEGEISRKKGLWTRYR